MARKCEINHARILRIASFNVTARLMARKYDRANLENVLYEPSM
ncbi:MAG: hypothetical protein M2R45_00433 [Verrucomicrobia subdivision 3 bacterium]|nr:hypothetical protein [Limisphaerales bacterium]MCS1413687.1 hypothetical protein [Limisphaerales bacterium]